ncbi:hypothetical protein SCHPADRAFT_917541 [Schizopora paradoxa]|uniref:Fatty acid desaturase domain-containing protein n=1 Tax=Schizopora paradoxa TaxID=27342 RepID=A0A0H2RAA0_9AGAM|nr:hypothetical protein SCHPADRAFT_917541 [Schizopora paradoxa]
MGVEAKTQVEEQAPEFTPMPWSIGEIRAAIPARLFERKNSTSLYYLARDLVVAAVAWEFATWIEPVADMLRKTYPGHETAIKLAEAGAWLTYWWFQGLIFTGLWVVGHECGHGAFSASRTICDTIGFVVHSVLWTPYFSWRYVHHRHHANHASMERDEVYVPKTRSDLGIPEADKESIDWNEHFGDTPIYILGMLIRQQLLAFPAYMFYNVSGQKNYPKWTNHFNPNAVYFKPEQRNGVIASNIGILAMIYASKVAISTYGTWSYMKYYFIPWLLVNHWFTMITYLHHTDAELPHYRSSQWNFQRGAAATVDRDFLGWQGRFFLHDVAHYHVCHHFFPQMPHYHGQEATKYLKEFIGEHYHRSSDYVFPALWKTYKECQFVEDKGDVLFYKNMKGSCCLNPSGEKTHPKIESL